MLRIFSLFTPGVIHKKENNLTLDLYRETPKKKTFFRSFMRPMSVADQRNDIGIFLKFMTKTKLLMFKVSRFVSFVLCFVSFVLCFVSFVLCFISNRFFFFLDLGRCDRYNNICFSTSKCMGNTK